MLSEFVFNKLFPAKQLLIIYDEYDPNMLVKKLSLRKDKYVVKKIANISMGLDNITLMMDSVDGVVIFDVHSEIRNRILKI